MFKGYKIVTENGFQKFYCVRTGLLDFTIDLKTYTIQFKESGTHFDPQTLLSISSYTKTLQKSK